MADKVQLFGQLTLLYHIEFCTVSVTSTFSAALKLKIKNVAGGKNRILTFSLFTNDIKTFPQANNNKNQAAYLDVFHVCIAKLFSEMFIFLEEIDDFSEVVVIVKSSIL